MKTKNTLLIGSALTLAIASLSDADASKRKKEKCYGITKAGQNDCKSAGGSCKGSSLKDNDPTAWVFMPKGLCQKLVGGSLEHKEDPHGNMTDKVEKKA